jgi:hypothetical protein
LVIRSTSPASTRPEHHKEFTDIRDLLRQHKVDVAMAGDTHDFEFL